MGVFEYVSVLTSIIVGLGIAHLLRGVAGLIQHPGRHKSDWIHLLWVGFMFFQAIFWWWWEFAFESLEGWTFQLYLFVLLYATLIYLLCALLFPSDLEGYAGYEGYFMSRRRWFFGIMTMYFLADFLDTWLKGAEYFASLGLEYPITSSLYIVGSVIGMLTMNRRYHAAFALIAFVYQIEWAFRSYSTIG